MVTCIAYFYPMLFIFQPLYNVSSDDVIHLLYHLYPNLLAHSSHKNTSA